MISKDSLISLFVLSNPYKEGDEQIGGTKDPIIKENARKTLSSLTIGDITSTPLVQDKVTDALYSDINQELLEEISLLTIQELKDILLSPKCSEWVTKYRMALSSEVIASVVKIMNNNELSTVSKSLFNPINNENNLDEEGDILIGSQMHFGSRIQPNSPGDDPKEILFHTFEGLVHGCGDVIIGLNPSSDTVDQVVRSENILSSIITRLKLPTRFCVLSDMVKQSQAKDNTKVDVGFQSLAGTSKALVGMLGVDVDGYIELSKKFDGLYFETGQGSEVTNHLHEGIDMVTLESRCYGLARHIKNKAQKNWMIVNDVSGFIGPEVYRTGDQLLRACLEDMVMGKLHGITMGLDVCSTFHMGISPQELEKLTVEIVDRGAPAFLMAVAGKADPMLGYLTTAIKEHPRIRKYFKKKIATPMLKRLVELGILNREGNLVHNDEEAIVDLYVKYIQGDNEGAKENVHMIESLKMEAKAQLQKMRNKGFDIGYGKNEDIEDTKEEKERLQNIYINGVTALRAELNLDILSPCLSEHYLLISSSSQTRDDYIAHPESGENLNESSILTIQNELKDINKTEKRVLFVISDGLNANAINSHIPLVLPKVKKNLLNSGIGFCSQDIAVWNGRVRLGYQIGEITNVDMIVHFIGERPGTGLDQMSVYITYGKDGQTGESKWSQKMDHCLTTAICGIHPKGKSISEAIDEVTNVIKNGLKYKATGVELSKF